MSRCFVKCKVRAVCFANVVLLLASLCFLEVPWGVFEVSWGALEASLERLGAAVEVS